MCDKCTRPAIIAASIANVLVFLIFVALAAIALFGLVIDTRGPQ